MASSLLSTEPSSRIEALRHKHLIIKERIHDAQKRPTAAADYYITQLKKQKLLIKEEIEGLRKAS